MRSVFSVLLLRPGLGVSLVDGFDLLVQSVELFGQTIDKGRQGEGQRQGLIVRHGGIKNVLVAMRSQVSHVAAGITQPLEARSKPKAFDFLLEVRPFATAVFDDLFQADAKQETRSAWRCLSDGLRLLKGFRNGRGQIRRGLQSCAHRVHQFAIYEKRQFAAILATGQGVGVWIVKIKKLGRNYFHAIVHYPIGLFFCRDVHRPFVGLRNLDPIHIGKRPAMGANESFITNRGNRYVVHQ